jgi:hypothetical protein
MGAKKRGDTKRSLSAIAAGGCQQLPDPARWEGSLPLPAAAGLFAKPSVFVDRVIGIRL